MKRLALILLLVLVPTFVTAQPLPDKTERVIALAKVWSKAKWFHPYLAYKDIDWDAALLAAIPKVESATTTAEYRAAITGMLAVLDDPVTRVLDATPPPAGTPATATGDFTKAIAPNILEIRVAVALASGFDPAGVRQKAAQVISDATKVNGPLRVLVVDLRGSGEIGPYAFDAMLDAMPAIAEWPLERTLEHHGFRTQEGNTSGNYYSTFVTTGALPPHPSKSTVSHVVFVVDPDAGIPVGALALQAGGRATIVVKGALDEAAVVTTTNVTVAGDITVRVRLGELLTGVPAANVVVGAKEDAETRAIALAKTLVASTAKPVPMKILPLPQLRVANDNDYARDPYPGRELRVLAAIRLWATLDTFFPYRYLIADWERDFREMLPKIAAATDRDSYRKALQEFAVRAGDGHIGVRPVADPGAHPKGLPPFRTRMIEKRLAVVQLLDATEAKKLGVAIGDTIETVDGKPVATVIAETRARQSGSTEEARDQLGAQYALVGDEGSIVKIGVRGADAKLREVAATRTDANFRALWADAPGPHWKMLANNVGYVDLTALVVPEVDKMFADLGKTRAIVFDMRGYPNGTAWSIAPRINTKHAKYGAQFLQPYVTGDPGSLADQRVRFLQEIPKLPAGASIYTGKIFVLIDDRAISQSEHTCLFFQETAGATFVGSPTHGANGDVTQMRLPGGLRMSFTGQEVRHVDGKQLQKVGIQPHIVIRPTLAGIRAGKDELLDRALATIGK